MPWFMIAQAAQQPSGPPIPMILLIFGGMLGIMYLLQIRPMQKREKEKQEMHATLAKGVEVITAGGIYGTIVGLTDHHVVLRVDDEVKIKFLRSSVMKVVSDESKEEEQK